MLTVQKANGDILNTPKTFFSVSNIIFYHYSSSAIDRFWVIKCFLHRTSPMGIWHSRRSLWLILWWSWKCEELSFHRRAWRSRRVEWTALVQLSKKWANNGANIARTACSPHLPVRNREVGRTCGHTSCANVEQKQQTFLLPPLNFSKSRYPRVRPTDGSMNHSKHA